MKRFLPLLFFAAVCRAQLPELGMTEDAALWVEFSNGFVNLASQTSGSTSGTVSLVSQSGFTTAGQFTGSTTGVVQFSESSLNILGDVTVMCWVKITAYPASGATEWFVGKSDPGSTVTNAAYALLLVNASNRLRWSHYASTAQAVAVVDSTDAITTGTWWHVAAVRQNTSNITFYTNGNADSGGTKIYANQPSGTANSVRIGSHAGQATPRNVTGFMDDVRVYPRALSAAEIKAKFGDWH